jgi:hypothetical protein
MRDAHFEEYMSEVGRPSVLDDEQKVLKIKDLYLSGLNEKQIAEILEIPLDTWNYWKWKNYQSFNDKLLSYKHERMLLKAETNLEVLMASEDERVKADVSKFVSETIGKKHYSKKTETDLSNTDGSLKSIVIIKHGSEDKPTTETV